MSNIFLEALGYWGGSGIEKTGKGLAEVCSRFQGKCFQDKKGGNHGENPYAAVSSHVAAISYGFVQLPPFYPGSTTPLQKSSTPANPLPVFGYSFPIGSGA